MGMWINLVSVPHVGAVDLEIERIRPGGSWFEAYFGYRDLNFWFGRWHFVLSKWTIPLSYAQKVQKIDEILDRWRRDGLPDRSINGAPTA